MTTTPTPTFRQAGFTLMEMVIGVVLLGILSVVGSNMLSGSFLTTRVISNEHLASSAARYAMERMVREIREIQYDTTTHAVSISSMSATQMAFVASGLSAPRNVSLSYAASQIVLSTPDGSATLLNNVSAFSLSYLNVNRQVTALADEVRYVRIAFTVSSDQAQALSLVTQVSLRNT